MFSNSPLGAAPGGAGQADGGRLSRHGQHGVIGGPAPPPRDHLKAQPAPVDTPLLCSSEQTGPAGLNSPKYWRGGEGPGGVAFSPLLDCWRGRGAAGYWVESDHFLLQPPPPSALLTRLTSSVHILTPVVGVCNTPTGNWKF